MAGGPFAEYPHPLRPILAGPTLDLNHLTPLTPHANQVHKDREHEKRGMPRKQMTLLLNFLCLCYLRDSQVRKYDQKLGAHM